MVFLIFGTLYTNLRVPVAARAFLSCPGKKGSKEAGWGGFELCAPAHKATSPDPTRRARSIARFTRLVYG